VKSGKRRSIDRIRRFLDYFSRPQFEAAMDAAFFESTSVGPRLPAPL